MDAASYLKRHGWRGDGHGISRTGQGIKKPLLVSKKVDVLGIGVNKHAAVSDQWWMRAFDQGLKDLGSGKQSVLGTVREKGVVHGGLYGRFVKGEGVAGTFEEQQQDRDNMAGQKRKRGVEEVREVKRARKRERSQVTKEHSAKDSIKDDIDREAKAFVAEAVQRGLIPMEDGARLEKAPRVPVVDIYGEAAVSQVFEQAGLDGQAKATGTAKQRKYARETLQRAVKRTAKAHIIEQLPAEKREQLKSDETAKEAERKAKRKAKEAEAGAKKAEEAASKEAKKLKKQQKREKKRMRQTEKADDDGTTLAEFDNGADEVKLGETPKVKTKKVPGVGVVDRYPTKAEKKAKKIQAQLGNVEGAAQTKSDAPEPLVGFVVDTAGDTSLVTPVTNVKKKPKNITNDNRIETISEEPETSGGFVVDTAGDTSLSVAPSGKPVSMSVVDAEGNVRYTCKPGEDVPLDPSIWEGITVKDLPPPVRAARRVHMEQKRAAKKGVDVADLAAKTSRGERKAKLQEDLVLQLLIKSRHAAKSGDGSETATLDAIENVPLVRVSSRSGAFDKEEMALARTVVRRVLKGEKKKAKAERGRGRGKKTKPKKA